MNVLVAELSPRELLCSRLNFAEGPGGKFTCRMIEPGIVSYMNTPERDVVLIRKETIDRCLATAVRNPITVDHVDPLVPVPQAEYAGAIDVVRYNAEDGWFYVEGQMDEEGRALVRKGYKPSCAYVEKAVRLNTAGEKYHGFHYDKEITELEFHHLAIVKKPKYEGAIFRLNSIPTMKLFKAIFSVFSTRKNAAGQDEQVVEEKALDIPGDTLIHVAEGKTARLNELGKAWMDATAGAATCDEIDVPAAGELPACRVKTADLVKHYQTTRVNEAESNKAAEARKVADEVETARVNSEKEKQKTELAARENALGDEAFKTLQNARNRATLDANIAPSSSESLKERCDRGAKRY